MKPVSIAAQRKLLFIPVVNSTIVFIWVYNLFVLKLNWVTVLKSNFLILACAVPYVMLMKFASYCMPGAENLIELVCSYLFSLCLGYGLIRFQESL